MEESELKTLIETLKKEREEQNAKINGLTKALEEEKVNREKEVLIAKINSLGDEADSTQSIDFLKGYHSASVKFTEKINCINSEILKINGCIPSASKIPPQKSEEEMINTPIGRKKKSEVDSSFLAVKVNSSKPEEVK
jgi:hypothetical protein